MKKLVMLVQLIGALLILSSCAGVQSFSPTARAGDTTSIAAGWKHNFSRENISITITPSFGAPIVIPANDPSIRAVINLYPDPLSSLFVSEETNQDLTPFAQIYSDAIIDNFTSKDKDWWQTTVFFDLPPSLPIGVATIDILSITGESHSSTIEIIDGVGQANTFKATILGAMQPAHLHSLERVENYAITFSGVIIPHAIQVEFTHDADVNNGGVGVAYVSNPRGDLKNVMWKDDGFNLIVYITPSHISTFTHTKDLKFYVTGGVTGLLLSNLQAVDNNGDPVVGITVNIN